MSAFVELTRCLSHRREVRRIGHYVLPLLAIVSLLACGKGGAAKSDEGEAKPIVDVAVTTVKRGDITASMSVTGTLAPMPNQEAKVAPMAPGRIKTILVKVGDQVRKGQVVATLDPGVASGQVQQAQAAVRVAVETLAQARVNLTAQTRTQSASVDQARLNLDAQRVALAKLRAGSRPQEIAQSESAVASAQAALTSAQQTLARSQTLFSEGLIARKDLEAAQAQERTANAALISAQQALSLAKQGNRPEDIRAGEVAVSQAEQQLRAAQSQIIQNASKAQDVRIAQAQLAASQGVLTAALAQSRALVITSPLDGTVVGRTVNTGEAVDVTSAVATIVNLDQVRLILNVPTSEIPDLPPGALIEFSSDADPGAKRTAHVTVINRAVDPASNTVQVEAVAANPDHALRDDGFVKARIFTARHTGVILVPVGAVVDKEDKSTVYLAGDDGVAHEKEVEIGVQDGAQVEIKSGLKAGDRVVTTGAYELDDGTKIKVGK